MQGGWKNRMMVFDSRADARLWKSNLNGQIKLRNASVRNVKMKRRLVQANWDDYNDSFSYNAKGNENGR